MGDTLRVAFVNELDCPVDLYWENTNGQRDFITKIDDDEGMASRQTYHGHRFSYDDCLRKRHFLTIDQDIPKYHLRGDMPPPKPRPRKRRKASKTLTAAT